MTIPTVASLVYDLGQLETLAEAIRVRIDSAAFASNLEATRGALYELQYMTNVINEVKEEIARLI